MSDMRDSIDMDFRAGLLAMERIRGAFASRVSNGLGMLKALNFLTAVIIALYPEWARSDSSRFQSASPEYTLTFPRDQGAHERFQTEWWYYTGQLYDEGKEPFRDKPRYGFQLTFFRRGGRVGEIGTQGYLAHAVLADIEGQRCDVATRSSGPEGGLAGSSSSSLRTWLGPWSVESVGGIHVGRFDLPLRSELLQAGDARGRALLFLAEGTEAPWLHGERGYSRKASCEGCASMYYSLPQLSLRASLTSGETPTVMHGLGWMDHEFMTNSLSTDQVGWDWMGLLFRNGDRLMLFRLRRKDGTVDFASGTLLRDGISRSLASADFTLDPSERIESPSGARYPTSWRVRVPTAGIDVTIRARIPVCEVGGSEGTAGVTYWEGPVADSDESVLGYLEMTGYAGDVHL